MFSSIFIDFLSPTLDNRALWPMNFVSKGTPDLEETVCACAIWTHPVALTELQPCPGSWSVPAPRFSNAQALKHLELQTALSLSRAPPICPTPKGRAMWIYRDPCNHYLLNYHKDCIMLKWHCVYLEAEWRCPKTIQVTAGLPAKKPSGQWSDLRCSGRVQPLEGLWLHHLGSGTLSRSLPIFLTYC